jgi:hypothetical protein
MLERIAAALGIDTLTLFCKEINLPETMKITRKAALEDLKNLIGQYLDGKIKEIDKEL